MPYAATAIASAMIDAIFTWSDESDDIITVETRPMRPVVERPSELFRRLPV
jgi:hypothetical protein